MTNRAIGQVLLAGMLLAAASGCSLSARQRTDITAWEAEAAEMGHPEVKYTQTLDPNTALGLSFLPFGIAGFYVHRPGLGVTGILFWPLSITWTAPVASTSAVNYDYAQFRSEILRLRAEARASAPPSAPYATQRADEFSTDLERINKLHAAGKLSDQEYAELRRRLVERFGSGTH